MEKCNKALEKRQVRSNPMNTQIKVVDLRKVRKHRAGLESYIDTNNAFVLLSDHESCPDFPVTLEEIKETIGVGCTECKKELKRDIGLICWEDDIEKAVCKKILEIIDNMEVKDESCM